MLRLKQIFKRNSHSRLLKPLAGFGRSINRLYENRNHDIYSNGELTLLKKLSTIRPDVIIDGGANIGNYSILASKTLPICKVYAFEPVKTTFQHLVENTKNHYCIKQINKGLYNQNCSKEIFLYPKDEWASLFNIEEAYKSNEMESIDLVRGDDFVAENDIKEIDLLKLDIEGAEYDALLGFEESFKHGKIKVVQFEYGYINITTKKLLIDYYKFFKNYGYIVGKIFPKKVEFREYSYVYEDFLGPNFIAVKKSDTELINLLSK